MNDRVSDEIAEAMANTILGDPQDNHVSQIYCGLHFEIHALVSWAHPASRRFDPEPVLLPQDTSGGDYKPRRITTEYQHVTPKLVVASGKKMR